LIGKHIALLKTGHNHHPAGCKNIERRMNYVYNDRSMDLKLGDFENHVVVGLMNPSQTHMLVDLAQHFLRIARSRKIEVIKDVNQTAMGDFIEGIGVIYSAVMKKSIKPNL
jgi:hypothetical protein